MATNITFKRLAGKYGRNCYPKVFSESQITRACNLITDSITDLTITIETDILPDLGYNYITFSNAVGLTVNYFITDYECSKGLYYYHCSLDLLETFWEKINIPDNKFIVERSSSLKPDPLYPYYPDLNDDMWIVPEKRVASSDIYAVTTPFVNRISNTDKCYTLSCYSTSGITWSNQPPIPANNPYVTTYAVDANTLMNVRDLLCDPDLWTSLEQIFAGDPAQSVVACNLFPFVLRDGLGNPITSGSDFNLGNQAVPAGEGRPNSATICRYKQILRCGRISIERFYKDFRDYEPYTTMEVWLPYYGSLTIDPTPYYRTGSMFITYYVDPLSGECLVSIGNNETNMVDSVTCELGCLIPITSTNRGEINRNVAFGAFTLASSAAMSTATYLSASSSATAKGKEMMESVPKTGKGSRKEKWRAQGYQAGVKAGLKEAKYAAIGTPLDVGIKTFTSSMMEPRKVNVSGGLNGNTWNEDFITPFVRFYRPTDMLESWQEETYGRLCMQRVDDLTTLSGFCKLHNPVFNPSGLTMVQYEELKDILESGFYINVNSSIIEQEGET